MFEQSSIKFTTYIQKRHVFQALNAKKMYLKSEPGVRGEESEVFDFEFPFGLEQNLLFYKKTNPVRTPGSLFKLQMTFSDYGLFGVRSKNYGWERRVWHRKRCFCDYLVFSLENVGFTDAFVVDPHWISCSI